MARKGKKGKLIAGPVQQYGQMTNNFAQQNDYSSMNNQASNIADFDYHIDSDEEEQKFEVYTKSCSNAVQNARNAAKMSQGQLAEKIGEKTTVVVELENGTGRYVAGVVNSIEKALNCKIPRGRNKRR